MRPVLKLPFASIGLVAAPAAALVLGLVVWGWGSLEIARWLWIGGIGAVLAALMFSIAGRLRRGEFGLDIIAALAASKAQDDGEPLASLQWTSPRFTSLN